MSGVNKVILVGRLGKDPEARTFENGNIVATFSLATSETFRDKQTGQKREITEWHNVISWRQLAEIVSKYCRKGDLVFVEGKLATRSWEKNGVRKTVTEVVADSVQIMSGGKATPKAAQPQQQPDPDQRRQGYTQFGEPLRNVTSDDLPF